MGSREGAPGEGAVTGAGHVAKLGATARSGAASKNALSETVPRVLNKRHRGNPVVAVYVGRPSKWGNPFEIGKDGTRQDVVIRYSEWICEQPALLAALPELRGKDLVCWCAPAMCHADVLRDMANGQA